jgi:hypothetical protein
VSALRALLYAGGAVATGAGLHTVVAGARSVPGRPRADARMESELRYYAGFYAAYGLAVLRVAPRADRDAAGVRAVASALLLSGLARAGAWRANGAPHPGQRALLALELGLPPVMVALQRQAGRGVAPSGRSPSRTMPR